MSGAKVKYFLEIKSGEGNDHIAAYLAEFCIGEEAWSRNQEDTNGNLHDVCEMPSFKVLKLAQTIERQDTRISFGYWERQGEHGRLRPADYLLDRRVIRRTKEYRRIKGLLPKAA